MVVVFRMGLKQYLILLFSLLMINRSNSISCYLCENCYNPDDWDGKTVDGCKACTFVGIFEPDGSYGTIRGCATTSYPDEEKFCVDYIEEEGGPSERCFHTCLFDYCNTAQMKSPQNNLAFIVVLFSIQKFFM